MWDFLVSGGVIMIPLGLCSITAATITAERLLSLRRSRVMPREIVSVVESVQPGKDLSVAISICARNPGVFSDITRVGLESAGESWQRVRDAILDAGRQETPKLERHLVWLETIAAAAPLLGLLGTVLGMIKVFSSISVQGLGDPQVLSEGISEAMITTAVGLGIGIPTLVAYNLLSTRSETLIVEIEAHASRLIAKLRSEKDVGGAGSRSAAAEHAPPRADGHAPSRAEATSSSATMPASSGSPIRSVPPDTAPQEGVS